MTLFFVKKSNSFDSVCVNNFDEMHLLHLCVFLVSRYYFDKGSMPRSRYSKMALVSFVAPLVWQGQVWSSVGWLWSNQTNQWFAGWRSGFAVVQLWSDCRLGSTCSRCTIAMNWSGCDPVSRPMATSPLIGMCMPVRILIRHCHRWPCYSICTLFICQTTTRRVCLYVSLTLPDPTRTRRQHICLYALLYIIL